MTSIAIKPILEIPLPVPEISRNTAVRILTASVTFRTTTMSCEIPGLEKFQKVSDICQIAKDTIRSLKDQIKQLGKQKILVNRKTATVAQIYKSLLDVPDDYEDSQKVEKFALLKVLLKTMKRRERMISNPKQTLINLLK
jgi:hypothetical protein